MRLRIKLLFGLLTLLSMPITFSQISVSTQQFCGPAVLNLSATGPNQSDFKWYNSANGGPSLGTGTNYTTQAITYSQSYFVTDPHMSVTDPDCALFYWYDSLGSTNPVGSGCNFTETGDIVYPTYYVQDSTKVLNAVVGYAPGDLGGETTNWTTNTLDERYAIKFDAHQTFTLNSFELKINYPTWSFCPGAGGANIRLFDVELLQNNSVIQSAQPTVSCDVGTQIVTVDVGFQIAQGTDYKIRLTNLQQNANQYIVLNYQGGTDYAANGALDNDYVHMTGYGDDGNAAAASSYGGLYNWDITAGNIIEVHNPRTLVYVQDTCNVLCGDSIDLNTWVQGGITSAGDWSVSNDGTSVNQSINAPGPSFFVSSEEYINVELTGSFIVNDVSDNDYAGFVFGYTNPLAVADTQQFYLFDWKKQVQLGGDEGFHLVQVNDTRDLSTINHSTNATDYWDHTSTANYNVLQSNTGPGTGWVAGQLYHFTFTYTSARTVIVIDGGVYSNDTIIDIGGCFNSGRFGFYNFSQADVTYSDFTYKLTADYDLITPSICVTDSGEFISIDLTSSECNGSVVENNIVNWAWDMGDGSTYSQENVTHKYDSDGPYNVFLEVEDSIGCTANVSKQIIVNPALTVDLSAPVQAICQGNNTSIHATPNVGASYEWFRNGASMGAATANDSVLTVTQAGDYYVAISHSSACGNISDTITIITSPLPTGSILPVDDVCAKSSQEYTATLIQGATYAWSIANADSSNTDTNTVNVYFGNIDVDLEVIITDSNGCVSSPIQETIAVLQSPTPAITGDTSACPFDTVALSTTTTGTNTYTWATNGNVVTASSDDAREISIQNSIIWVSLVEENNIGCKDSTTIQIHPHSTPTGWLDPDTATCPGTAVDINFHFEGDQAFTFNYNSDVNGTSTVNNHNDSIFTLSINDSETIALLGLTDINGCQATNLPDTIQVLIHSAPDTLNFADSCLNASHYLVEFDLTSGDTSSYAISGLSGSFTSMNHWVSDSLLGGNSYSLQIQDTNACAPITINGTVNCACPISPEAGSNLQTCPGDSIQLSASGGTIFNWTPDLTLSNDTIADPFVDPLVDTYYHVLIENAMGCTGEDSVLVEVHDSLMLSISSDTSICFGDSATLFATGGTNYTWSPSPQLTSSNTSSTTFFGTNTTTLLVIATDANSCFASDSVTVNIFSLPNVLTNNDTTICEGESTNLTATGADTFIWTPNTDLNSDQGSTVSFTGSSTRTYYVNGTDLNGCSNADSITIGINSLPNVNIGNDTTICLGDSVYLNVTGASIYNWTNSSGIDSINGIFVLFPTSTSTFITNGTDANGCTNVDSIAITVLDNPVPTVDIDMPSAVCEGDEITYNASGTFGGTSPQYQWYISADSGATFTPSGTNSSTFTSALPLNSFIYVGLTSNELCVSPSNIVTTSDTALVPISQNPDITLNTPTDVCLGETTYIQAIETNSLSPLTYQWYYDADNNGEFDLISNNLDSIEVSEAGDYQVAVTYQGICTDVSSPVSLSVIEVTVDPSISDSLILQGETIALSASTNGTYITWTNSLGDSLYSGPLSQVFDTPEYDETYFINAFIGQCSASASISVDVIEPIEIPDAFTPNGDGINDYFTILGIDTYAGARIELFNRWGNVVHSTYGGHNYAAFQWDGIFNGKQLPAGVYYYTIDLGLNAEDVADEEKLKPISGSVMLLH